MTRKFRAGLVGWPVAHSFSPLIHNLFFDHYGMDGSYQLFPVESVKLAALVSDLKKNGYAGLNVTIPHKVASMRLCDTLSSEAEEAGAVNTIVFKQGAVAGYNTDTAGFRSIIHDLPRPFFVLGTGGVSGAVAAALSPGDVVFMSRGAVFEENNQPSQATVVNATPLGWNDDDVFPFDIPEGWNFVDLNYNPCWNWRNGLVVPVITGEKMLVEQASESFRLWTGLAPDEKLKTKVLERIRGELHEKKNHG